MRHKYLTPAVVIARTPSGEANLSVALLTREFGIVYARAQGARKPGAKMAAGLQTLAEAEVTLLRGKDGWRLAGTILTEDWAHALGKSARERAARTLALADRLVRGESGDPALYLIATRYLRALKELPADLHDGAETLAALRLLATLGLDTGEGYGDELDFSAEAAERAQADRSALVSRINRGIAASGL